MIKKAILPYIFIGLLMFMSSCKQNTNKPNYLSITPPFKNIDIKTFDFEINNNNDTLLKLNNGTSINIPKYAFQTKSGQSVENNIKIQFTEFDNPSKIIASGIPMTYTDQQGHEQQMESAGMFEIRGFSDNQELVIKNNKSIEVNLASTIYGDYDFFFLQENESRTKGNWKIIDKNTLTDSINVATGKSLEFDTTKFIETKLLSKLNWNIRNVSTTDSLDWIFNQTWNILDISKPTCIPKLVSKFKNDVYYDGPQNYLSPDSTLIYTFYKKEIYIRDWNGKLIKRLNNREYSGGYFVNNDIFLANNYENGYRDFYNKNWELIASLKGAYNFRTLRDNKFHVYTNINKSTNTHFFIDIVNYSGQPLTSIKCKKHPRKSHSYGWGWDDKRGEGITEFILNKEQNLIGINTGEGVFIYDITGKQIKKIKYSDTYNDINFLNYNDALLLEDWKGKLTVWDWKNNKFIKMPNEIKADKFIDTDDHPNKPILLIANRDAKFFLLWDWEKDIFTKHSTSHELDQLHFSYGYIEDYIGEYSYKSGFERLWNDKGDEIIKIEEFPDMYASIRAVNSGNRIISNNGKEFSIYKSSGEFIKGFKLDDARYSQAGDYYDKFFLYNQNGSISFLDSNGVYLSALQLDQESRIWSISEELDYLIFVNTAFNTRKVYKETGELKANFGRYYIVNNIDSLYLIDSYNDKEVLIMEESNIPIGSNEFQIILQNKEYQFIGIVELDFVSKKVIEQYQELYLKNYRIKELKEKKRFKQESKLVRSFTIQKFGIYNWDRIYKRSNAILCKAKLVLDKPYDIESYNSYLITGENKNTVIKYSGNEIEKFVFDPTSYNQLLMILPENQVAVMTNNDFKNISANKLTEESELVLKLTEYGKVESIDYLNKIIEE